MRRRVGMSRIAGTGAVLLAPAMATAAMAAPAVSSPSSADLSAAATSSEASTAKQGAGNVYMIHALTGQPVSVSIDGEVDAQQVSSGDVLGPLSIAPGKHTVNVEGANPSWSMQASVTIEAGGSVDVVLHRPAAVQGPPTVTVYDNPTQPVPAGKGRVMVAHTATVPPADIEVDGKVLFANVANGEFATADVPAGTHEVAILPTGREKPVLLGPLDLPAEAATLTQVFAVGRPANGSMDVVVHTLPVPVRGSSAPDTVNTGTGGLVSGLPVDVTGR
jgi:hypothetical protein